MQDGGVCPTVGDVKNTFTGRARLVMILAAASLLLAACGSTASNRALLALPNNNQGGLGPAVGPSNGLGPTTGPNGLPTTPGSSLTGQTPGGGPQIGGGGTTVT